MWKREEDPVRSALRGRQFHLNSLASRVHWCENDSQNVLVFSENIPVTTVSEVLIGRCVEILTDKTD